MRYLDEPFDVVDEHNRADRMRLQSHLVERAQAGT
jgi:hypothetical protein